MTRRHSTRFRAFAATAGLIASCIMSSVSADDPVDSIVDTPFTGEHEAPMMSEFWIGISGSPIDGLLKSQLRIQQGVAIQHVLSESPAAEAGLKEHDIIIELSGTAVADVAELARAVAANGDREVTVTLLRAGKKKTVKITPGRRPDELPSPMPPAAGDWGKVREWIQQMEEGRLGDAPQSMFLVRPGVVLPQERMIVPGMQRGIWALRFPKGTRITMSADDDGPMKITVHQGDKTWDVAPDQLDGLPADVREFVQSILARKMPNIRLDAGVQWFPLKEGDEADADPATEGDDSDSEETPTAAPNGRNQEIERMQKKLLQQQQQMQQELDRLQKLLQVDED